MNEISLGLLGRDIAHSRSQQMYEDLLSRKIDYELIDCVDNKSIPPLNEIFKNLQGLSITAPYKEHFLNDCMISDDIIDLRAVNCIKAVDNGFVATNTDYSACEEILLAKKNDYRGLRICLIGSGAMSRVILSVCEKIDIKVDKFSRTMNENFYTMSFKELYSDLRSPLLIINSCSRKFIFKNEVDKKHMFWDLNYEFHDHDFLRERFSIFEDGLELLKLQAKHALSFWSIT